MLSKSQARRFFLVATVGFSGIFLWLTVDTLRQVPDRSNEAGITEQVAHGKRLWESSNCMGCHTILGEGAYYAPELTQVVQRRGKPWIKAFIKDPEAMFPGQRKMVKYDFTDEDIDAVIAFLEWVGQIDTNGFPKAPDMALPGVSAAHAAPVGTAPQAFSEQCVACHSLGGQGGAIGPALDGVGSRMDRATLRTWLMDPAAVKPGTAMPKLHLDDADLDAISSFLSNQR